VAARDRLHVIADILQVPVVDEFGRIDPLPCSLAELVKAVLQPFGFLNLPDPIGGFGHRDERLYRLLGCEMTITGDLPRPGETLRYEIHVDGHARQGAVRLFFFHYDCHVDGVLRIQVRGGQAGFFTEEELATSAGILWTPEEGAARLSATARLDPPAVEGAPSAYTADAVAAFAAGRPWDCFGPAWRWTMTHLDTPRIQDGRMLFLGEVTHFEPRGGPWGRGYLRATTPVTPQDWFFEGHFLNDPCMPGTLMFEASVQTLSFFMAAMGFTLRRDDLGRAQAALQPLLAQWPEARFEQGMAIARVSAGGAGMPSTPGTAARMFRCLAEAGINIEMIATSEIRTSCVVAEADGVAALQAVHGAFGLGGAAVHKAEGTEA
jgi:3-hydroxymyristoyl/3-hydroxydecanoyl-(acyl carrier protein) dehydratase